LRRDLRNELDGARGVADAGDALACEIDIVPPTGRVEGNALEALAPLDPAAARPVQLAPGGDDVAGGDDIAGRSAEKPQRGQVVPSLLR
jgi:hypothetical protein